MIERDPRYYTTGYSGDDPYGAPFYRNVRAFDGPEGDLNSCLIDRFNRMLRSREEYAGGLLENEEPSRKLPARILVINASHDDLPTSYETARIFSDLCERKCIDADVRVINDHRTLMAEAGIDPMNTLIMSQCVDKKVYNVDVARALGSVGAVVVPGAVTAPGGVFSDKDSTYRLLSGEGRVWDRVAMYRKVSPEGRTVAEVVEGIFEAVDELERHTGDITFFVKPHEGGGGLGGFRITKIRDGYIIPDLSKVSADHSEIHPTFIDIDVSNEDKLRELLWIYRLFSGDELMRKNYIQVDLPIGDDDEKAIGILREYLAGSELKRHRKLATMALSRKEASDRLIDAIGTFEEKFSRRYVPLVNEHIDFGLWGLRAHYRFSVRGPLLETMYHRVFQLGFTPEGLGYVGADNISNKQTGALEITRLGPINEVMVRGIGGEEALFDTLLKGVDALMAIADLVPREEQGRVPLRVQLDLAAISRRIGEGNADTARGLCLASRWPDFVRNAEEWLEDSLAYYAWRKNGGINSKRP